MIIGHVVGIGIESPLPSRLMLGRVASVPFADQANPDVVTPMWR